MATPAPKALELESAIETHSQAAFGRGRIASIKADICVCCGGEAKNFRNPISVKEYSLSGFCQKCQDATFGTD